MDLFSSLRRFRPSDKRDPLEDFLTAAWRWVLENDAQVAGRFLARLGLREGDATRTRWDTQVRFANGAHIVDLVGQVEGGPVIVCEHKVWSRLADRQIEGYRAAAGARWPGRDVVTVLITARAWQQVQRADHGLTWADVHQLVGQASSSPILREFNTFLESNHLGPSPPVVAEALLAYSVASNLKETLHALFTEVARRLVDGPPGGASADLGFAARMARVLGKPLGAPPEVSLPEKSWGRLGFELPSEPPWRPGCFVGVLLDPRDHRVTWSDPARGPDLTVILSFHVEPGVPDRSEFLGSAEYRALLDRLAVEAPGAGIHVHDHLSQGDRGNPWHPLHLRRPLVDVLGQTVGGPEQTAVTLTAIEGMFDLLLRGGELEGLAARLRAA